MLNRDYNALLLSSTKFIKIARFSDTLVGSALKSWHFGQLEQTYAIHDRCTYQSVRINIFPDITVGRIIALS